MDPQQLIRRMNEWLRGDYTCCVAEEDGATIAFYETYGFRVGCLRMEK